MTRWVIDPDELASLQPEAETQKTADPKDWDESDLQEFVAAALMDMATGSGNRLKETFARMETAELVDVANTLHEMLDDEAEPSLG